MTQRSISTRHRFGLRASTSTLLLSLLAACGGGGGSDPTPAAPPGNGGGPAPVPGVTPGTATVTLLAPSNGKASWNLSTPISVTLLDGAGALVSGTPSCASADTVGLTVAADCSTVVGNRLGTQSIVVSAGSVSASTTIKVVPQAQPLAAQGVTSSYGSGDYNLATVPSGKVVAWGANPSGVLGQGQFDPALQADFLPVTVKDSTGLAELTGIQATSAGTKSVLALTEDGEVWSWGSNTSGALGRAKNSNDDALPGKVNNPALNGNLAGIVAVSPGDSNVTALSHDGTVYTWGSYGGRNPPNATTVPGQVLAVSGSGVLSGVVAVSSGSQWAAALTADGRVVSWGFDLSDGRTGHGAASSSVLLPANVVRASDGQPLSDIVAISAGYDFGLALTSTGQVWAWGDNHAGQMGQNTQYVMSPGALQVKGVGGVGLLSNITMVAAGGNHALVLDSSGRVFSWGSSGRGELGDGAAHPRENQALLPAAVVSELGTGQLSGMASIAAGYAHSLALAADGSVYAWGAGFQGDLGQGSGNVANLYVPTKVKDAAGTGSLSVGPVSHFPNLLRRAR